ncbi:hypothetical protein V6N12_046177 [Hibiscus sabdariffa]|uniref:Uncharacterized protein n=1 Tax=Hibiscus sabdariffa TaxID=183260 RepID=A0ABR2B661_9ROSI
MFSSIDVDLAARRLQQLLLLPKIGLPPLPQPTIPTVLKPGSLPQLPSIPNLSSVPKVTLRSFPLIPTISTTIPFIPFLFPPHQLPVLETIWLLRHGFTLVFHFTSYCFMLMMVERGKE